MKLEGAVALVTGGGRGVGREIALLMAKCGAKVIVNDLGGSGGGEGEDVAPANEVVTAIKAAGGEAAANFDSVAIAVTVASWIVSLVSYALVILLAGFRGRLVQALTAIIGCGALIFLTQVAGLVFLTPFLGALLAQIFAYLLLVWSVRVKGHIIACTIDCTWYMGVLIAISVFVLQYVFSIAVTPAP